MSKRVFRSGIWIGCLSLLVGLGFGINWLKGTWSAPRGAGPSKDDAIPLPEEERSYIGKCEHHGQLLSQRGFPVLTAAIKEANAEDLRRLLADDFRGTWVHNPRTVHHSGSYGEVVREEDQGQPYQDLSG